MRVLSPAWGSGLEEEEGPGAEARGGVSSQQGHVIRKGWRGAAGRRAPRPDTSTAEPPGGQRTWGPGSTHSTWPPAIYGGRHVPGWTRTPLSEPPGGSLLSPPLWVASCWGASEPQHPLSGLSSHHGRDSGSRGRVTAGTWEPRVSHGRFAQRGSFSSFERKPAPRYGMLGDF